MIRTSLLIGSLFITTNISSSNTYDNDEGHDIEDEPQSELIGIILQRLEEYENQIEQLKSQKSPSGQIAAFNLEKCPLSWVPADGTNGTPDLRGMFLRGINDFGSGPRTDGMQDPNNRTIGHLQNSSFGEHSHYFNETTSVDGRHSHSYRKFDGESTSGSYVTFTTNASFQHTWFSRDTSYSGSHQHSVSGNTNLSGSQETRPNNIGVIYCIKDKD